MTFTEKLQASVSAAQSVLCVGLDPDPEKIPEALKKAYPEQEKQIFEFCKTVIAYTKKHACAYKPNTAFFEALGAEGWQLMADVFREIPADKILIADAKRGDIGNTAARYKHAFFDRLKADAVTLNPLMGMETLDPFMDDPEKAVFVLTMTSNKGAADFLQRRFEARLSLGEYIAEEIQKKQSVSKTHLGMVTGATQAGRLKQILKASPESHLLIPGIGSQGGSTEEMAAVLEGHKGIPVFNSSRSVIYAGSGQKNWFEHVEKAAASYKKMLKPITKNYV